MASDSIREERVKRCVARGRRLEEAFTVSSGFGSTIDRKVPSGGRGATRLPG